jgi:hypothetical protein
MDGMIRLTHTVLYAGLLAGAGLLAQPAHAQDFGPHTQGFHPVVKPTPGAAKQAPPPALPGAQTSADTTVPSDRPAGDLPPTEALFDAINRGDIGAARDAISRGADLGGHNVLDMTPLELSVDLDRNDITFLLLSMRGVAGTAPAAKVEAATARPGEARAATLQVHAVAHAKPAAARPRAVAQTRPAPVKPPVEAARPATAARQYAGPAGGGTPNPQAGFLGFGGTAQP